MAHREAGSTCWGLGGGAEGLNEDEHIVTSANFLLDSREPIKSCREGHEGHAALRRAVRGERIIDFSARNRFIVFLFVFGVGMAGWWAMRNIPIDAIPDISDTQVIIYTTWMGRSPDLVETQFGNY